MNIEWTRSKFVQEGIDRKQELDHKTKEYVNY